MGDESTSEFLFDQTVPLPYRVTLLIQLGQFLWLLVVFGCAKLGVNVVQLINFSYNGHNYPQLGTYSEFAEVGEFATIEPVDSVENGRLLKGIWSSIKAVSVRNLVSFAIFKVIQVTYDFENPHDNTWMVRWLYKTVPTVTLLVLLHKIFYTSDASVGKLRVYTTVKRIARGKINTLSMRTNDILLSDSLVSYSKVLNDIGLYAWTMYVGGTYNNYLEFTILCLPTAIRVSQCYQDYRATNNRSHLFNLTKYLCGALPVFVNFLIKFTIQTYENTPEDQRQPSVAVLYQLNLWWYLTSFISSVYSFIWDVKMDWGFELFDVLFHRKQFRSLRTKDKLVHSNVAVYFLAIYADFLLRFIWVLKIFVIKDTEYLPMFRQVSLFLFGYDAFSFGYCFLEFLEILRRFMWCFFKLESDWVKLPPQSIQLSKLG